MMVHFMCRGNAYRSILAEAYLNSLQLPDVQVSSSGTVAAKRKQANAPTNRRINSFLRNQGLDAFAKANYGESPNPRLFAAVDVVIFLNHLVRDDFERLFPDLTLPPRAFVWDIMDFGEGQRIPQTEEEKIAHVEENFGIIKQKVDELARLFL